MPNDQKKFYLTTPIYYVNARPHIGHAYTTIVADVLARRHRLLGDDTFFLTGTDEHGQKIERSAAAAGIPPQQFADEVSASFRTLWKRMGITNDAYIRTTDPAHARGVQKLFATLYEKGFIYLASYTGSYCVSDEAFIDAPVGTPCPDCGRLLEEVTEENFFFKLSEFQLELINRIESDDPDYRIEITPAASKNEVLSFLRGNFAPIFAELPKAWAGEKPMSPDDLFEYAAKHHRARKSPAGHYYLPGALKDLSISRSSFTWGIPVPEPAASEAKQPHVIYVWLDALANYMTALGYGAVNEDGSAADTPLFDKFWPADLHLVGKEITRFHCIYWPAFLLAAELPLPKAITAHGWLLFDNSKMSKSKGNIVRTETILEAFGALCPPIRLATEATKTQEGSVSQEGFVKGTASAVPSQLSTESALAAEVRSPSPTERDLFASDVLRYFLLREIPFGQDGSFSFDAMITRYNADLANGYGNLVSRVLSLIQQNESGTIAAAVQPWLCLNEESRTESTIKVQKIGTKEIIQEIEQLVCGSESIRDSVVPAFTSRIALRIGQVDFYLSSHAPWKLAKSPEPSDRQRMEEVLYTAAESIRIITALLYPILPYATANVWSQLGLGDIEAAARNGQLKNLTWGGLQPGTKLGPLSPIFPRADKSLAETMITMENETTKPASHAPASTDPAAPPREIDTTPTLSVGGSDAITTERPHTPHTEAQASAPFTSQASQTPITAGPADASPQIAIDDFVKIELRVAQILLAERIPKADKLLRLEVDLGFEKRQILSGIAEWYTPEDLIGRRIIVITNLAPRKMRGLESHGMLLAASEEGSKPFLATVPEGVPVGTRLK